MSSAPPAGAHIADRRSPAELPSGPDAAPAAFSGGSACGSHLLAALNGCVEFYNLRYFQGLRPAHEPPWRLYGTLMHHYLAYHYGGMLTPKPAFMDVPFEQQIAWTVGNRPDGPEIVRLIYRCYEAYCRRYSTETIVPMYVEEEFCATLKEIDPNSGLWPELDNHVVTARIDLVAMDGGFVDVWDHKCTSASGKTHLEQWNPRGEYALNAQVFQNLLIARARLGAVRTFRIQRVKRKEPFDFDRREVYVSPLAYEAARYEIRWKVKQKLEWDAALKAGFKAPRNHMACSGGKFGPCDYHQLCSAGTEAEAAAARAFTYTTDGLPAKALPIMY